MSGSWNPVLFVWDPAIAWHPRRLEGFFGQKMFNPLISSHLCFFFWCQTSRSFEGGSTKCMGEHTQCMYRSWLGLSKYTCWGGHLHFSPFWRLVWTPWNFATSSEIDGLVMQNLSRVSLTGCFRELVQAKGDILQYYVYYSHTFSYHPNSPIHRPDCNWSIV